jgi:hypothetical protein
MNTLRALIFLASCAGAMAEELIPVRHPEIGESRPAWWLSLWMDHVVVIKGTASCSSKVDPDIEIKYDQKVMENVLGKEDAKYIGMRKGFRIGTIKIESLLFASPGITHTDMGIEQAKELKFLLPLMTDPRDSSKYVRASNGKDSEGIFIFSYGSMLISPSLVYVGRIPDEGVKSAYAVIEHRTKFNHITTKENLGEQAAPRNR